MGSLQNIAPVEQEEDVFCNDEGLNNDTSTVFNVLFVQWMSCVF